MRTVVITGGGKGIGAELSRVFYANGDKVVIASRGDSGLAASLGERARFIKCDVSVASELHQLAQAALAWGGSVDVWVNNAGRSAWNPLDQVAEEFWDQMLDINLKGVFFGCQAAARVMQKGGCIVNISSLAGKRGSANNTVYCAAKFGVNGVTQALAKELGPRGIRVNALCPVYVETEGLMDALADESAPPLGQDTLTYLKNFAASQTALQRLPLGTEVAQACLYFASAAASAITGQCVNVDCGVMPQ
jgi:3-oxoacyl-[acyl-carrier protein] reductase/meso-butanediol dehydrogenase/(S,S)-butanediol dehydrogenase/diacetyl reductase